MTKPLSRNEALKQLLKKSEKETAPIPSAIAGDNLRKRLSELEAA